MKGTVESKYNAAPEGPSTRPTSPLGKIYNLQPSGDFGPTAKQGTTYSPPVVSNHSTTAPTQTTTQNVQ